MPKKFKYGSFYKDDVYCAGISPGNLSVNKWAQMELVYQADKVLRDQPFLGHLASTVRFIPDHSVKSFETTDNQIRYNPSFVRDMHEYPEYLPGTLLHQFEHCSYKHAGRKGERDDKIWDAATDLAINGKILEEDYTLPSDALVDHTGQFNGLGAEDIYEKLKEQQEDQPEGDGDGDGEGEGENPISNANALGCLGEQQPGTGDDQEQGQQGQSQKDGEGGDGKQHKPLQGGTQWGTESGWTVEELRPSNLKPDVSWPEILREYIDDFCKTDYTWTRPNARYLSNNLYLPGKAPDGIANVIVCIDTSGSISTSMLQQFMVTAQALLDESGIDSISIYDVDTRINAIHEYDSGDFITAKFSGRGGTCFREFFDTVGDIPNLKQETAFVVMFTDCYVSYDNLVEPEAPVLWLCYGDPGRVSKPPFGKILYMHE